MFIRPQKYLLFFSLLTFFLLACCVRNSKCPKQQNRIETRSECIEHYIDTNWREPLDPPDLNRVNFINVFSRNINIQSVEIITELLIDLLDAYYYLPYLSQEEEGKRVIKTSFINISEKIEDYKSHFLMLIFSIELTSNNENVQVIWRYGLCQAPFRSRYWIYNEIPFHVRDQVKSIVANIFQDFINRANQRDT